MLFEVLFQSPRTLHVQFFGSETVEIQNKSLILLIHILLDAPIFLLAPDYVPISIPMSIPNLSKVVSYHIIQVLLEASVISLQEIAAAQMM